MTIVVPVEFLQPGDFGCVDSIDGEAHFVSRLEAMGVRPGAYVQLVRGGTPCILAIGNQRLSFRGEEAARILVALVHDVPGMGLAGSPNPGRDS